MRPDQIRIVEVGPRDGLQNEAQPLTPQERVALIEQLADAGLRDIEAGSLSHHAGFRRWLAATKC